LETRVCQHCGKEFKLWWVEGTQTWTRARYCKECRHALQPFRVSRPQLIKLRLENPNATLSQLGKLVGCTDERVRQILKSEGLPTKSLHPTHPCLNCGKPLKKQKKYCNRKCWHEYTYTWLTCPTCGKLFESRIGLPAFKVSRGKRTSEFYCSKRCWGKVAGKKYGFGSERIKVVA